MKMMMTSGTIHPKKDSIQLSVKLKVNPDAGLLSSVETPSPVQCDMIVVHCMRSSRQSGIGHESSRPFSEGV